MVLEIPEGNTCNGCVFLSNKGYTINGLCLLFSNKLRDQGGVFLKCDSCIEVTENVRHNTD